MSVRRETHKVQIIDAKGRPSLTGTAWGRDDAERIIAAASVPGGAGRYRASGDRRWRYMISPASGEALNVQSTTQLSEAFRLAGFFEAKGKKNEQA